MKVCWGVDVQIHVILSSTLVGGEWSATRPGHFTHIYPLGRKLDGSQSRSGRLNVASRYIDYAIPALRLTIDTLNTSSNICRDSSSVKLEDLFIYLRYELRQK
jgi:hypothetical protein